MEELIAIEAKEDTFKAVIGMTKVAIGKRGPSFVVIEMSEDW